MANQLFHPCPQCGGVVFYSPFLAGRVYLCLICDPPLGAHPPKQGPGIIQPDGTLLTAGSITNSIRQLAAAGQLAAAKGSLGPEWVEISSPKVLASVNWPTTGSPWSPPRGLNDVPDSILLLPGDPMWVDRAVEDAARAAHAERAQLAAESSRPQSKKSDVSSNQAARKKIQDQQGSRKRKLPSKYPTDLSET